MRTRFCPHCASEKINLTEEEDGAHYHECEDCNETWEHHDGKLEAKRKALWCRLVAALQQDGCSLDEAQIEADLTMDTALSVARDKT